LNKALDETIKILDSQLTDCKIAKTVGNSVNIVGVVLLFTPLFLLGIGTLVAGSATTIGTVAV
jgi:hypothetical protein